jgi:hypothetical protein
MGKKKIWDGTLSMTAYREVLDRLKVDFPTNYLIAEIPQILSQIHRPKILIRHDITGSLSQAWDMARVEHELGYRASYMVPDGSPDLDPADPGTLELLHRIRGLGHEIGLYQALPETLPTLDRIAQHVEAGGDRLSELLGFPIFSVSFSAPPPETPEDSQFVGSKINATAPLMMRWVLEDSRPAWEIETPRAADEDPDRALLQVIVRPEAWGS